MKKQTKRIFAFSVILAIFLLSTVNGTISVAAITPSSAGSSSTMEGDGLTFNIQKGDPIPQYPVQYGVTIPDTNMWTSYVVHASNQGEFKIKDWDGTTEDTLTINNPGDDISLISPWDFDFNLDSLTDNDYIDPWDIRWLQANASSAESDTLMPYTVNSVWHYYVMTEGSSLSVPVRDSTPIQVDIIISSSGPKVLKCNKIRTSSYVDDIVIISPSGKILDFEEFEALFDTEHLFWYYIFVAQEVGTYRLLLHEDIFPDDLEIEFLDFNLKTLPLNTLTYGGTGDDTPSLQDYDDNEWTIEWWKFSGNKGDKFTLEKEEQYGYDDITDFYLWYPTCSGYEAYNLAATPKELFLPTTGNFYISTVHSEAWSLVRYSLLLKPISVIDYSIGDELTTIYISKNERKAIEFEIPQDSFVRFNFTTTGFGTPSQPLSDTEIVDPMYDQEYQFIFEDAKKFGCHEEIDPIDTKMVAGEDFYYYYMPAGKYEAIIRNLDDTEDGIFQISSKFVDWAPDPIPVNTLSYPERYPAQSMTFEFLPDEFNSSLKQAKALTFDVTGPGQFYLNTTMLVSDNLAAIPSTGTPTHLYTWNNTDDLFYSLDPQPVYSMDGVGNGWEDLFLIASPYKFTGAQFNFTTPGDAGGETWMYIWGGSSWNQITGTVIDGTNDLTQNGTIELNIDADFEDWEKGCPYHPVYGAGTPLDIPMVNEDDYYWLVFDQWWDYTPVPIIDQITLLNMTISGNINFALLRDSGYEHCDVWWPADIQQPAQITDFMLSQDEDIAPYESVSSPIIKDGDPWTIGIEEGTYKLLVIPENWDYPGNISINFAIVDYWGYSVKDTYTIDSQPLTYPWNITDSTVIPGLHLYNYSTYPYDLEKTYNNTEVEILGSEGYFVLDCYGSAYNWTQLVIWFQNISLTGGYGVDIYLMQDLPWVDNDGPNNEVVLLADTVVTNNTIEFGVLSDHFTLIFECRDNGNEMIGFKIGLSQYNTGKLTTTAPVASGISILGVGGGDDDDDDDEEVSLPIPIWVLIGVVAIIGGGIAGILIFLKKKGR
ncbi:MAG: hypothetical protein EU540_01065, partial [Promethearchaeota archaeon]